MNSHFETNAPTFKSNFGLLAAQCAVDSAIRSMGGYWPAFAGLARILEELGELTTAIEGGLDDAVRQEAADVVVASIALANQYGLDLGSSYSVEQNVMRDHIALHGVLRHAGQIARAVNRFEGSKPPKPNEASAALGAEFVTLFARLAQIANCQVEKLLALAVETVENNATRDAKRFAGRIDAVTSPVRDAFVALAIADDDVCGPQLGIWGEIPGAEMNGRIAEVMRFCRVDAALPLAAFVLHPINAVDYSMKNLVAIGRDMSNELRRIGVLDRELHLVADAPTQSCFLLVRGNRRLPNLREGLIEVKFNI